MLRLAQVPGIIGIKDATANIERGTDLIRRAAAQLRHLQRRRRDRLALILLGGHGVISVTANVAPKLMHQMCAAALVGDVKKARELNMQAAAAAPEALRRGEPDPGEMGAGRRWA